MALRLHIDGEAVQQIKARFRALARRAERLEPLAYRVRDRWLESERRIFQERPWPARRASTLRRYRYPVRRWRKGGKGPMRRGRAKGRGTGSYTGAMQRVLTRAHQRGQRDTVLVGRGRLDLIVGVQKRGPVAHANLFHQGAGSRPPRPVVVFDEEAARDASADAVDYILGTHAARSS